MSSLSPKPKGGKRPGAGRPEVQVLPSKNQRGASAISIDILEAFCEVGCTQDDIAAYFRISKRTLQNIRKKNTEIREIMRNGHLRGKMSLRRKLWEKAMKGDIAALIFLNKNENGMSDKLRSELSGPDGKPMEVKNVSESTAILNEFLDAIETQKVQNATAPAGPDGTSNAPAPKADSL